MAIPATTQYIYSFASVDDLQANTVVGFDPDGPGQVVASSNPNAIGVSIDKATAGGGQSIRVQPFDARVPVLVRSDGLLAISPGDLLKFSSVTTGFVTKDDSSSGAGSFLIAGSTAPDTAGARVSALLLQVKPAAPQVKPSSFTSDTRPAANSVDPGVTFFNEDTGSFEHSDGTFWRTADGTLVGGAV